MHATSIQTLLPYNRDELMLSGNTPQEPAAPATVLEVLWRRRATLIIATLALLTLGAAYLLFAPKIYISTAQIHIAAGGPSVFSDHRDEPVSDDFIYTQAELARSSTVLSAALKEINYHSLRTFAGVNGDPAEWLRSGSAYNVEVGHHGEVLNISMESKYPQEAAQIVNAVVKAFVAEQTRQREAAGSEKVRILRDQKAALQNERQDVLTKIAQLKENSQVLSFKDDKQNVALEHLEALTTSYTTAQLAAVDLRAELDAAQSVMVSPQAISAYVQAQQTKDRDGGDKELDELRNSLSQLMLSAASNGTVIGSANPRIQAINADIELLKKRIADKEKSIVQARVQDFSLQLSAAEEKEMQLKTALDVAKRDNIALVPQAEAFARLDGDAERLQKQSDQLDARIMEVSANSPNAGALTVQVLESAHAASHPAKPFKPFVLGVAAFAGLLLGCAVSMFQEWRDPVLRGADEVSTSLGIPVVGIIPRIPPQLSVANRGQLVHIDPMSPPAEAFRALRTAVNFGPVREARTIAVVSPLPGDGKSTTASNLAIALAEAGHRTLLIDCDMRRPIQHTVFGVRSPAGLSSVLNGEEKLRDVIHPTGVRGLYVLPAGPLPRNPSELLGGKQFQQVMDALGTAFERIVIDSPPLAPVTDGRILAAASHATLVVLRLNQSVRKISLDAIDGLKKIGANILGAVVNDVPLGREYSSYYGNLLMPSPEAARRITATVSSTEQGMRNGDGKRRPRAGLNYLLPEDHLALGDAGTRSDRPVGAGRID